MGSASSVGESLPSISVMRGVFSDFATGTSIPAQPRLLPRYTLILRRWKRAPLNPFEANVRFGPEVDVLRYLNRLQVGLWVDARQYPVISR